MYYDPMTQAPTPGQLSVGDRVVAVADLRKHPDGPVWVQKGEEVGIVREYGIDNCIAGVALQDGREGDWAKSCFRLAPTAPVEASGSEREEDALEALDWIEKVFPGQGDTNDQGVTVRGWQRLDQACATIRTALVRPQPSGETRDIGATSRLTKLIEDMENLKRAYHPSTFSDPVSSFWRDVEALSARPLASGGQHSGGEWRCEDCGAQADEWFDCCKNPARAEAQDEGAAGEPVAKVVRKGFSTGSISWTKFGQDADLSDETPLYAHPSPTPAADADRVRK